MKKRVLSLVLVFWLMALFAALPASAAGMRDVIYDEVYSRTYNAEDSNWIADAIMYASATYNVDPVLITAMMEAESGFDFNAYSRAGAIGLMQLMPGTAQMLGVDPWNPLENVLGGTKFIGELVETFSGWGEYGVTYAVAAYNAGPYAVKAAGGVPNNGETPYYVINVARYYEKLSDMLAQQNISW